PSTSATRPTSSGKSVWPILSCRGEIDGAGPSANRKPGSRKTDDERTITNQRVCARMPGILDRNKLGAVEGSSKLSGVKKSGNVLFRFLVLVIENTINREHNQSRTQSIENENENENEEDSIDLHRGQRPAAADSQ